MYSPFNCSKTAKLCKPPVLETGLFSPSLLDSSVTVTFGLQLFAFTHDFLLERSFFSLLQPRDRFFFFFPFCRACMCQPSRQKNDTARCNWQQEVNVIRCPLPRKLAVLRNACTRVPDENVCVTSRSMWETMLTVL